MSAVVDLYGILARVRKLIVPTYADQDEKIPAMNDRGELIFSQSMPDKCELVRLGQTVTRTIPTGSAFTHVAAWPTTRAELVIKNGENPGGRSYVFDNIWAANAATSIAAASAYTLLSQMVNSSPTDVTDNAAVLTSNRAANGKYASLSRCAVANTSYGIASKWEVLGTVPAGPAASIGLAVYADVYGGIILPPGAILLLNLVVGTATGTAIMGATWHEAQLPIP